MQTQDFKGKEIFNYITASINGEGLRAPQINGKPVAIDDSEPITFRRMKYIHAKLEYTLNANIRKINLNLAAYEPGDGWDGANPKLWDKTYTYEPGGVLSVYENGDWLYDEDGTLAEPPTDLVTQAEAVELGAPSVQAVNNAIRDGRLVGYNNPQAEYQRQGRTLVSRAAILELWGNDVP